MHQNASIKKKIAQTEQYPKLNQIKAFLAEISFALPFVRALIKIEKPSKVKGKKAEKTCL